MGFKDYWVSHPFALPRFSKDDKLSKAQLEQARNIIKTYQAKGWSASKIKAQIQKELGIDEYRAARVFDTEVKRNDVAATHEVGNQIGFTEYKTILSPNACALCRRKSDNGNKVFSDKDIHKTGYGQMVPWHPNCFCILYPIG